MAKIAPVAKQFAQIRSRLISQIEKKGSEVFRAQMRGMLEELWSDVQLSQKYFNVTGNAATGFALGLYHNGKLVYIMSMNEAIGEKPIRGMLKQGEVYPKGAPTFEGGKMERGFRAQTGGAKQPAYERARRWLRKYSPAYKKGFCYVLTNGITYMSYLQTRYGVNLVEQFAEIARDGGFKQVSIKRINGV